jgi:plastocyanin
MREAWRSVRGSAMLERMRSVLLACLLAGLATGAACLDPIEPLALEVAVEANRTTAAPGDTITFAVDTQGGSLVGVKIEFGDAAGDVFVTSGARTAHITFRHAYTATGTFTVRATVTDSSPADEKSATIEVRVQ